MRSNTEFDKILSESGANHFVQLAALEKANILAIKEIDCPSLSFD